ncbi:RNA-DNA hybrid ribonuclease [Pleodorina starrii]|nr:RNA-DNA hybrid ribonuclease [Pleodorina starrii]
MATEPVPRPPRQGAIWWSVAPPAEPAANDPVVIGISEEQLRDWLSCTAGWKALELTWGALQSCDVRHHQLKPLLQAAMAEAARLGASRLVVRQLDVDEVLGRCLALALSGFPNFTVMKLRELNLYDEAMGHLSGSLHSAEHLRVLVLDSVWASAGGWSALGAAIKVNKSLTTLRMRDSQGGAALAALSSALSDQHGCLETLRLAGNRLGDAGVEELCRALTRSCTHPANRPSRVAHLDLSYNGAGRQCVPAVAAMLRTVRALRHLDLSYNDLGAEAVRELCSALSYAPHVTSLSLAATGADDSAVEALTRGSLAPATALAVAASGLSGGGGSGGGALATLCLAHNRISSRGAALLAAAARRPGCPLVDIDLGWNALIGEEGAKAWAEVLAPPSSSSAALGVVGGGGGGGGGGGTGSCRLRRLVLSGCEVPDAGAFALGAALKTNSSLRELGLVENHISTRGLALLAEVLKVNSALRLLDVSLNMVGPQGMAPLSRMNHSREHVALNKSGDRPVHQRVGSSCVVKAELLPEYRSVEAVKNSREPWEREQQQGQQQAPGGYSNPFLEPSTAATAAAGASGLDHEGGYYNPFLTPSSSTYVNPFLDPPAAAPPPQQAGGLSNPFLDGHAAAGVAANPFLEPAAAAAVGADAGLGVRSGPDNPFLSSTSEEVVGKPFLAGAAPPTSVEGRELSTRVLTRLGTRGSVSGASGDRGVGDDGGGSEGDGGGGSGDSGSGTGVYVSSRSTADEADLVTDLDLDLVDRLLEDLGVAVSSPHHHHHHHHQQQHSGSAPSPGKADATAPAASAPQPLWLPPTAPPKPKPPPQAAEPRVDSFWSDDESSPADLAEQERGSRHVEAHVEPQAAAQLQPQSQSQSQGAAADSRGMGASAVDGWAAAMAQLDELSGRGQYEQSYEGYGQAHGYSHGEVAEGRGGWGAQEAPALWGGEGSGSVGSGRGGGVLGALQELGLGGEGEGEGPAVNPFL